MSHKKIGLFFGSFNPIHIGHLIVGNIMVDRTDLNEVWFVISPQNPFKKSKSLLHEFDRFDMVERAIGDNYRLKASDVEFHMPKPSYTVDSLAYLSDKYLDKEFDLIIGEDILATFNKWKNYQQILENHQLLVYPRPGAVRSKLIDHPKITVVEAPLLAISASFIRKSIKERKSIKYLVPEPVEQMIIKKGFFL